MKLLIQHILIYFEIVIIHIIEMPYVFLSQAESKTAFHKQQHSQNAYIFPGSSGHTDTYRHNRAICSSLPCRIERLKLSGRKNWI